jgi:signal transduction histidine kinase
MGQYAESERFALRALDTDSTDAFTNVLLYEYLAKNNIMLGNKSKAFAYFDLQKKLTYEQSTKNYQSSISEMEVQYETEKKEIRISVLEEEKKMIIWLTIAGAAVLLLTLAAFIFLWRLTVQKKRLAEKQRQLAEQQVKQLEQEKQLIATQAVRDGETQERTRLARDLHDGLGSLLSAVKLNLNSMKNDTIISGEGAEQFRKTVDLLDDAMIELRRVAHHLMPESLSRCGLKVALSDFCDNISIASFHWYGNETRFDHNMEVMIYRVVHELVNNAMKHSEATHIMVQVIREDDRIAFIVQDNGKGFDPKVSTGGMGIQNTRDRVKSFGGIMDITSVVGEGTEIDGELRIEN